MCHWIKSVLQHVCLLALQHLKPPSPGVATKCLASQLTLVCWLSLQPGNDSHPLLPAADPKA